MLINLSKYNKITEQQKSKDEEYIQFLRFVVARYRQFIMSYLELNKEQFIELYNKNTHSDLKEIHIKNMGYEQLCLLFNFMKNINEQLIGRRILPLKVNVKKYAKLLKGELNGTD